MDRFLYLPLACILAGFALTKVPLAGTFLAELAPVTSIIGVLAILIFSFVIIFKGIVALVGK